VSRRADDDLFLETLEEDADLAWRLAEAAARPAPAGMRERIVARHRRRRSFGLPAPLRAAFAFAVVALVVLPLSLALVQTRAELENERALNVELTRERAYREEYARVLSAIASGGIAIPMRPSAGFTGRGTLFVGTDGQGYLVLDLPEPPPGKAYEAWILRREPTRAGMVPVRTGVVTLRLEQTVKDIREAGGVALTLEVETGVDRPTSDPVLVGPTAPLARVGPTFSGSELVLRA
jgi:hypothetical protein